MANLNFIDQHNMVAYLKRTDGNAKIHQIMDFLTTSPIHYALTQIHATVDGKKMVISESSVRSDLHFNDEDGITCLLNDAIFENLALMGYERVSTKLTFQKVYFSPQWKYLIYTILHCLSLKSIAWNEFSTNLASTVICLAKGEDDRVVRATTTATSLEAKQESGNIHKTQSTATLNEPTPQRTSSEVNTSGSREDNMENQDDLMDIIPPTPYDSPLSGGHTPRSDDGRPNINELMAICTQLLNRVLAMEQSKTAQDLVIAKLQKKVKRLEKKQMARTPGMNLFKIGTSRKKSLDKENVSKQGRNLKTRIKEGDDINDLVEEATENVKGDTINAVGAVNTATTKVSAASASVTTAGVSISTAKPRTPPKTTASVFEDEDLTIAQTLVKMRS
nr:hypothetical protein [Tanacetum cinerariifolium]